MRCRGCGKSISTNALGIHLGLRPDCNMAYVDMERPSVWRPSDADNLYFRESLRAKVFRGVAELYWFRYLGETLIKTLMAMVQGWIEFVLITLSREVALVIDDQEKADIVIDLMHKRLNLFDGLESEAKVVAHATAALPMQDFYDHSFGADSNPWYYLEILQWLVNTMKYDRVARKHMVEESELWKSGELQKDRTVISSWTHGSDFKQSKMARPTIDVPGEPIELRISIGMGFDDVEPLDALKNKAAFKKLGGVYGTIGNLPADIRFQHEHMGLLAIGESRVMKKFEATRVFSGADPMTGELIDELHGTLGAQYRRLVAEEPIIMVPPPARLPTSTRPPAQICTEDRCAPRAGTTW